MNAKQKEKVYQATGAGVFYDKSRRAWCALWLKGGYEHRLYFKAGVSVESVIDQIKAV